MSEINKQELNEMPLETSAVASRPQDNILRSFNALKPNTANRLLNNLKTVIKKDISEYISIAYDARDFEGIFKKQTSSFESRHEFSLSVGVKGKYGVFSASAKIKNERVDSSSYTTLYSTFMGELHMGNVSLRGMSNAQILDFLDPEMVRQLKAISSLADARDFTEIWGTHLIDRVNIGGMIFVSNVVETESREMMNKLSAEIQSSYNEGAVTLQTAINMSAEIKENTKNITQNRRLLGGDVHLARAVDVEDPRTIDAWAESVSNDTTYAVSSSKEIFTLVNGTASEMLKKYIDLSLLASSLESPVILTSGKSCLARNTTHTLAKLPSDLPKGFKVIGGGAQVTDRSNNFLMSSYPQATDKKTPTGWNATSHDLMSSAASGDVITSYAIAIHDPEDYIEVIVVEGKGKNTGESADNAEATLPKGWLLTCGGVSSTTIGGTANKFITASYFKDKQTWVVANSDYKQAATNVELKAFAVGIKSTDPLFTIEVDNQEGTMVRGQYGHTTISGKGLVCGGGVKVTGNSGPGNLVQMSCPLKGIEWTASSKDHDSSNSPASIQAFAISLHPTIEM